MLREMIRVNVEERERGGSASVFVSDEGVKLMADELAKAWGVIKQELADAKAAAGKAADAQKAAEQKAADLQAQIDTLKLQPIESPADVAALGEMTAEAASVAAAGGTPAKAQ